MKNAFISIILIHLVFAAFASDIFALTTKVSNNTLQLKIKILESCTVSATDLDFGVYNSLTTSNATSNIAVVCTNGTDYKIGLDLGTGSGTSITNRKMSLGPNIVNYGLYKDSARTQAWGPSGSDRLDDLKGTGVTQNWTVYGKVPSGQNVPNGIYLDTITVTVSF